MQIVLKNRDALSSVTTFFTEAVNVSGMPLITVALILHQVTGTTPTLMATMQTSDNMEDWTDLSVTPTGSAASYNPAVAKASTDMYGNYVRFKISCTGTTPYFNYSLFMNTFASS